jgi:NAD(P)-dependent dehydrogenase (short-subunit alcohol dehydrogenase family)
MVAVSLKVVTPMPWHSKNGQQPAFGSVLISGGLGGIGLLTGSWLAATRPKAHVWLLGRSGRCVHPVAAKFTQQAQCVTTSAVDITANVDVTDFIRQIAVCGTPAVDGIFHAGGTLHDALLGLQTAHSLRIVSAPKGLGALCLLHATSAMPVQGALHFSSLSAQLGTPGQSNYAAANGTLADVAQHHSNCGIHSSSVMWGPWATGMAASKPRVLERLHRAGLGVISGACCILDLVAASMYRTARDSACCFLQASRACPHFKMC